MVEQKLEAVEVQQRTHKLSEMKSCLLDGAVVVLDGR
jgi:hypothetical protein